MIGFGMTGFGMTGVGMINALFEHFPCLDMVSG
jgi:hypothetical protein